jgi:hypothetical protein
VGCIESKWRRKENNMTDLFPLGKLVTTRGALMALLRAKQSPTEFLSRHVNGDWGDLCAEDVAENEYAVAHGLRILSSYATTAGDRLWLITEADRSATTFLLPDEY